MIVVHTSMNIEIMKSNDVMRTYDVDVYDGNRKDGQDLGDIINKVACKRLSDWSKNSE